MWAKFPLQGGIEFLEEENYTVVTVVTPEDRRRGRTGRGSRRGEE